MTTALPSSHRQSRLWGLVAAGAFAWIIGYFANGSFWDTVVYDVMGLDPDSHIGASVHFFVYDTT